MKKFINVISILLVIALMVCVFVACDDNSDNNNDDNGGGDTPQFVDYVSQLKLDMNSSTAKLKNVRVKDYIDGDTTHFYVDSSVIPGGVLKARYLAINTPESTGKIEAYGKAASRFTREKLENAVSIVLESDTEKWSPDSTGSRYLAWVWYKTSEDGEYRNLNVEILQEGLAIASATSDNRYGETAWAALMQARDFQLKVYSKTPDPDLYVGDAIQVTIKELRCHIEDYAGKKVAFEGIVVQSSATTVYVESKEIDGETGVYYGMQCFFGYNNLAGKGLEILTVGNYVKIVGNVQYWETGGMYQVADLSYRAMKPTDPDNIQRLDDNTYSAHYQEIDAQKFANSTNVDVELSDETGETVTMKYPELLMGATISANNLKVISAYTTDSDTSSDGAMTLTCKTSDGYIITIRTEVLYDANNQKITQDAYLNKTINVKGIGSIFQGSYQVKVLLSKDITVLD